MARWLPLFSVLFVATLLACSYASGASAKRSPASLARLNTLLLQAARSGDLAQAKSAIAGGADVNFRDSLGSTPLMLAASNGRVAVAKLLLAQKADSQVKRKDGQTALSLAIGGGNLSVVRELVSFWGGHTVGEDPTWKWLIEIAAVRDDFAAVKACITRNVEATPLDKAGALSVAAIYGHVQIADYLLAHGTDVNRIVVDVWTPLMCATISSSPGSLEILERLLKAGAKVDAEDADGKTALMWAADHANLESIKVLIAHGADINHKDKAGKTASELAYPPLAGAISTLMQMAATHTMDRGDRIELVAAEEAGDISKLQSLLDKGGDVNARNDAGDTLLMQAAYRGKLPIIQLLIKNKADLEAEGLNYLHNTALLDSCYAAQTDTAMTLLDAGADPNAQSTKGITPLMYACLGTGPRFLPFAKALIARGAKVNTADDQGQTPFMDAARRGSIDVAKLLLDKGAQINALNVHGETGLVFAVENCRPDMVLLLIDRGADVNLSSDVQGTPLKIAEDQLAQHNSGNTQAYNRIILMLKKAGAHK